jgi:hypothetical protein
MLSNADVDITEVIRDLAAEGVEAGYLVPTATGLQKSIMDAHQSLRLYFQACGFHDFESQPQGSDSKVVRSCLVLGERGWIPSRVSLYRPNTKSGDPRIWISGLKDHAAASNLLVLIVLDQELYVVNASREIWNSIRHENSELSKLIRSVSNRKSAVEDQLLEMLREIWSKGFVPSTTNADNGVGDTLENLLGIKRNASRSPDFNGIELKASRKQTTSSRTRNRSNLFSLAPNWDLSVCKNGKDILDKYGYQTAKGKRALQVTLNHKPNAQGLYLSLTKGESAIENFASRNGVDEKVVLWQLQDLQSSLAEKHKATFWVKAESRVNGHQEEFHYQNVTITSSPLVQNFGPLVSAGKIELDYTFSEKERESGKLYVRDHGYLWKLNPKDFNLIFPSPKDLQLG